MIPLFLAVVIAAQTLGVPAFVYASEVYEASGASEASGAAEAPQTGADEAPQTGTAEAPQSGTAEAPQTEAAEAPQTEAAGTDRTNNGAEKEDSEDILPAAGHTGEVSSSEDEEEQSSEHRSDPEEDGTGSVSEENAESGEENPGSESDSGSISDPNPNEADRDLQDEASMETQTPSEGSVAKEAGGQEQAVFGAPDPAVDFSDGEISDANVSHTWGGDLMGLTEAREKTEGLIADGKLNGTVTVAVIDTGINRSHEWFAGRISGNSRSFVGDSASCEDDNGHGSHVAGVIAQYTPSNVTILALKALDADKQGSTDTVCEAITYAADQGAEIINLSLGVSKSSFESEELYDRYVSELSYAISYANQKGCVIVTSAGNEGAGIEETGSFPAGSSDVITVSAINQNKSGYVFSNTGPEVDFCAPGEDIYSAWIGSGSSCQVLSGTSMAAPFVSAALAYSLLYNPAKDPAKVLRECCEDLGAGGRDPVYGEGLPVFPEGSVPKVKTVLPGRPVITKSSTDGRSILIEWDNPGGLLFDIYRREVSEKRFKKVGTSGGGEFRDSGVISGKTYQYYIEAEDAEAYRSGRQSVKIKQMAYIYVESVEYNVSTIDTGAHFILKLGETFPITTKLSPEEARQQSEWSSLNEEVVSVSQDGAVTANATGTGTVHFSCGNVQQNFYFTVCEENQCGENLYWYFREEDQALVITGEGDMYDKDASFHVYSWPWDAVKAQARKLVIEDGVTGIGFRSFCYCHFPDGVEGMNDVREIREWAFLGSTISEIALPEHCRIDEGAFVKASSGHLKIPVSLTEEAVFIGAAVGSFETAEDHPVFSVADDVLFNKYGTELVCFPSGRTGSYQVPDGVTKIRTSAFSKCRLSEVTLPEGITSIPMYAFMSSPYLESVHLPDTLTDIEYAAFTNCPSLKSIDLPGNLINIGISAFSATGLTSISFPGTVRYISSGAFSRTGIEEVEYPDGIDSIGGFSECAELKRVVIPESVSFVSGTAFMDCTNLTDVYYRGFTKNYKKIHIEMFNNANETLVGAALHIQKRGTIPDTDIEWQAEGLSGDLTLTVSGNGAVPDWKSPKEAPWYDGIGEIRHIVIEDGITRIGSHCFYGMENLEDVKLPSSVQGYGHSVFRLDPRLELFHHDNGEASEQLHIRVQYLMALYSGQEFKPEVMVEKGLVEEPGSWTELSSEVDYSVEYRNTRAIGAGTITIRFMGEYADAGTVVLPFLVASKPMKGENIRAISSIELRQYSAPYTGSRHTPEVTVRSGRWKLTAGADYTLSYKPADLVEAGTYRITATGIGAYSGSRSCTYEITADTMTGDTGDLPSPVREQPEKAPVSVFPSKSSSSDSSPSESSPSNDASSKKYSTHDVGEGHVPETAEETGEINAPGRSYTQNESAVSDTDSETTAGDTGSGALRTGAARTGAPLLPFAVTGTAAAAAMLWIFLFLKRRKNDEEDEQAADS